MNSTQFFSSLDEIESVEQLTHLKTQLEQVNPEAIDSFSFLQLAEILEGKLFSKQSEQTSGLIRETFKLAEKALIDFSKTYTAWEVVFIILKDQQNSSLNATFQAANIFKNKLQIDYVTLCADLNTVQSLQQNLILVIKQHCQKQCPDNIMRNLCLGMAYLVFQTHQNNELWSNIGVIQFLAQNL